MLRALGELDSEGLVRLDQEEIHHLIRVRRGQPGDRFEAFVPPDRWFLCRLERSGRTWSGRIVEPIEQRTDPVKPHIVLLQALIKKDQFEWILQKATELGVAEIVPVVTSRTEVAPRQMVTPQRIQRWQKILVEAVKQSGRGSLPRLHGVMELRAALRQNEQGPAFVLDEQTGAGLSETLHTIGEIERCTVLIGPEGGWADEERALFEELGAIRVHLKGWVLRAETVPLVVLSILQYQFGIFR